MQYIQSIPTFIAISDVVAKNDISLPKAVKTCLNRISVLQGLYLISM